MVLKKNIKFLDKKESAFVFILLTPIFLILIVPATLVFIIRGIFHVLKPQKKEEQTQRVEPYF